MASSTFDTCYFVLFHSLDPAVNYQIAKFGDTRKDSKNVGNYRRHVELKVTLHGNMKSVSSPGKLLEEHVLRQLALKGMAVKIGETEEYLVTPAIADVLTTKLNTLMKPPGKLTRDKIDTILGTRFNRKADRLVNTEQLHIKVPDSSSLLYAIDGDRIAKNRHGGFLIAPPPQHDLEETAELELEAVSKLAQLKLK
jgi:hypothetical protein